VTTSGVLNLIMMALFWVLAHKMGNWDSFQEDEIK